MLSPVNMIRGRGAQSDAVDTETVSFVELT